MDVIAEYAFEIVAILIAAAAWFTAVRSNRISKHALQVTKDSNLVALRLRVREVIADAERSFLSLQTECQKTREQWEHHLAKQRPMMSLGLGMFEKPKELQGVSALERNGSLLLRQLMDESPTPEADDEPKLERFIGLAKTKSLQIERLRLQLESPRPFPH